MQNFIQKLKRAFGDSAIRNSILFTIVALVAFRFLSSIPIPGVNLAQLQAFFAQSQFFGLLNLFSGGGFSSFSIVMLGVGPYITASIIMQLLTMMSPAMKAMYQEEGQAGRLKFAQYSRWLTLPLAIIQAFGFLVLLQRQGVVPATLETFELLTNVLIVSAGSVLLVWLGELMSEYGVGNGMSMIIFAGIVSRIPTEISNEYIKLQGDPSRIPLYIAFGVIALVVIWAVIYITEAERPIPVTYAKRVRGNKVFGGVSTHIPLRINQAGVMPIIFALSILLFPPIVLNFISGLTLSSGITSAVSYLQELFKNQWFYGISYFILVFLFTYFYTAITFDPVQLSENLQKNGAFIPGVRPGQSTAEYIYKVLTRLTFVGALFLGLIAVLPFIIQSFTGDTSFAIGGTALLIVVSVVLDLVRKIDAQLSLREY